MVQKVNLSMTEDIAEEINDVSVAVNAVASNLTALDESLGTASERNVGTGTSDVVETSQLDTRLGTSGNLGDMAQENTADYVPNSATSVWTGSSASVPIGSLSEGGPGFYVVRTSNFNFTIYIRDTAADAGGSCAMGNPSTSFLFWTVVKYISGEFSVTTYDYDAGAISNSDGTIVEIYKL